MDYESQISLGRIAKIHGNEGSVSVQLEKEFIDNIPEMESVFLEIEGKLVPFFISHIEYAGGTIARLQFDGYREFDKISEFNGCRVFLTSTPEEYHQSLSSPDLTGFRIFSSGDEYVGTIAKITDNPGQTLLSVISAGGKEVLIPLHEDLIVRIIKGKKKIIMELPEGLAELNT